MPAPDRRYYATGTKPRVYFGNDFAAALRRFETWRTGAELLPVPVAQGVDVEALPPKLRARGFDITVNLDGKLDVAQLVPSAAVWATVAELIRQSPRAAARKLGIPELAHLSDLKPQGRCSLVAAGRRYFADVQFAEKRERNKNEAHWAEFVSIVGQHSADNPVTCVEDLTNAVFTRYADRIKADQAKPSLRTGRPRRNSYRRARFDLVRTVLNHAYKTQGIAPETHARIRQAWAIPLKKIAQGSGSQTALSPAEFRSLLAAVRGCPQKQAMFLTALNAAFYPVDIRRLRWRHVNLESRTLVFRREKRNTDGREGTLRVAVLWSRTVKALRALAGDAPPNPDAYVFSLDGAKPIHVNTVQDYFRTAHAVAKLRRPLSFSNLRDSVATNASRSVPSSVWKVVLGKRIQDEDAAYIESNPHYVAEACEAIERHYFGTGARGGRGTSRNRP